MISAPPVSSTSSASSSSSSLSSNTAPSNQQGVSQNPIPTSTPAPASAPSMNAAAIGGGVGGGLGGACLIFGAAFLYFYYRKQQQNQQLQSHSPADGVYGTQLQYPRQSHPHSYQDPQFKYSSYTEPAELPPETTIGHGVHHIASGSMMRSDLVEDTTSQSNSSRM
jgi:hypothetical protein